MPAASWAVAVLVAVLFVFVVVLIRHATLMREGFDVGKIFNKVKNAVVSAGKTVFRAGKSLVNKIKKPAAAAPPAAASV